MSNSAAAISATPAKPVYFPLWAGAIVGGLFLALFIAQAAQQATANVARVVVVDTNRLMQAKAMSVSAKDAKGVADAAAAFTGQLKGAVKTYADQGFIVMNTSHMVGWPEALDKTGEVAKALGVDLKLADSAIELQAARTRELLQQSEQKTR